MIEQEFKSSKTWDELRSYADGLKLPSILVNSDEDYIDISLIEEEVESQEGDSEKDWYGYQLTLVNRNVHNANNSYSLYGQIGVNSATGCGWDWDSPDIPERIAADCERELNELVAKVLKDVR